MGNFGRIVDFLGIDNNLRTSPSQSGSFLGNKTIGDLINNLHSAGIEIDKENIDKSKDIEYGILKQLERAAI